MIIELLTEELISTLKHTHVIYLHLHSEFLQYRNRPLREERRQPSSRDGDPSTEVIVRGIPLHSVLDCPR